MNPQEKSEIIAQTADYVKEKFQSESSGHDWWHMFRVWQLSKHILETEPDADPFVTELAALLHDIADWKFHNGDEEAGPRAARVWLQELSVDETIIVSIEDIIRTVSYKGAGVPSNMATIEGKIVHDADKLDAIGAIGIARTFAYGGMKGNGMYDPDQKPESHADFASYQKSNGPTINHFYEKLLLLKERMYTDTAKQMAAGRHAFMEAFLERFYREWDGTE
ncbi:MAG: hypothetical protein JWM37_432 [Candidatus Saccharibacteria bacterium]|nr:hypothetical protein [Candidatus Saccharibacteria bacterium]